MLSLEELRVSVAAGDIDTVIVAITDMQGRLQGKRCHARYFLDEVVPHNTEACAYLLAVDTDMNTVDGYQLASWETGYGDFMLVPDWTTMRAIPWQPGTALVLADVAELGDGHGPGAPVPESLGQVPRAQRCRAAGHGAGPRRRGGAGRRPWPGRLGPGVAPPGAAGPSRPGRGAGLDRAGR